MLLNDEYIGSALDIALRNLAKSYNHKAGNWRTCTKQLDNVARVLKEIKWTKSIEIEIRKSIQRRINRSYPTTAIRESSGHCTEQIASNAVKRIRYRLLHGVSSVRNFENIGDFV